MDSEPQSLQSLSTIRSIIMTSLRMCFFIFWIFFCDDDRCMDAMPWHGWPWMDGWWIGGLPFWHSDIWHSGIPWQYNSIAGLLTACWHGVNYLARTAIPSNPSQSGIRPTVPPLEGVSTSQTTDKQTRQQERRSRRNALNNMNTCITNEYWWMFSLPTVTDWYF